MLRTARALVVAGALVLGACGQGTAPDPAGPEEVVDDPAATPDEAVDGVAADDPFADDDPFAADDPFAGEDPFGGEEGFDDGVREGPGVLPPELAVFLDLPPGARLDHVEAFDTLDGTEYSVDASYHDAGPEEVAIAADHYRSTLPAAGWDLVYDEADEEFADLFLVGDGHEVSIIIDIEMGSVWINAYLMPQR